MVCSNLARRMQIVMYWLQKHSQPRIQEMLGHATRCHLGLVYRDLRVFDPDDRQSNYVFLVIRAMYGTVFDLCCMGIGYTVGP